MEIYAEIGKFAGIIVFLWYVISGLRKKIDALRTVIDSQNEMLSVMERRIHETEKIGELYRKLFEDLPKNIDNYKTIVSKTKDATIFELQNVNGEMARKLELSEKMISESGNSKEVILDNLRVLHGLLSKRIDGSRIQKGLILSEICSYNGRTVVNCVGNIISEETVENFLKSIGFTVVISDDEKIPHDIINDRVLPNGEEIIAMFTSVSRYYGWYAMFNDWFYVSEKCLSYLKDEFSIVKSSN